MILQNVHSVIKVNQEFSLKPYIDMDIYLKTKSLNDFEKVKSLFKLVNNYVFIKNMENVRKHRHIKIVSVNKKWHNERGHKLVSRPKYR